MSGPLEGMVGYSRARQETRRLVQQCAAGRGGVLVVHGEAGSGKSTLLADARAIAGDLPILTVTGAETEGAIPHAGLLSALRPVLPHLTSCTARTRTTLLTAISRLDGEPPGPFAVAAATLELVAEVISREPHLLLVDDAHWVDHESLTAMLFTLRRLRDEPLLALLGVRSGTRSRQLMSDLPGLELTGLDAADAETLLTSTVAGWAPHVIRSLVTRTGGNPLAMLELARASTRAQRQGSQAWAHDVVITTELERLFVHELASLPTEAGSAALAVALNDTGDERLLAGVLADLGLSPRALDTAIRAGVLRPEGGGVTFRHPLMRSASQNGATEVERRDMHLAFARVFATRFDSNQQAWHLGQAASAPDAAVGELLIESAARVAAAGDRSTAARILRRAAELNPDPPAAAQLLVEAGTHAVVSGLAEGADWLAQADSSITDPDAAGVVLILLARWFGWNGDVSALVALTDHFDDRHEPAVRSELHAVVALTGLTGFDSGRLRTHVRALLALQADGGQPLSVHARIAVAMGHLVDAPETGFDVFPAPDDLGLADLDLGPPLAMSALMLGRLAVADEVLGTMSRRIRQQTAIPALAWHDVSVTFAHVSAGRLAAAAASARSAIEISQAIGADFALLFGHGMAALVAGTLGRHAEWKRHSDAVHDFGTRLEVAFIGGLVDIGRGRLLLPAGKYDQSVRTLTALTERLREAGMPVAAMLPALPELIEALVRAGRTAEAVDLVPELERETTRLDLPHLAVYLRRAQAAVAADSEVDDMFDPALQTDHLWPDPLGRARTQLMYGERLRRMRRVKDSRRQLAEAHESFHTLGVAAWELLARRELTASGVRTAASTHERHDSELTPREAEIADLTRAGLSNREIAATLLVSPKTVESQLTAIYRKVGVTGRRGLMSQSG